MFWNRRNEHATDEDLSALLDGELKPARRDAVAAHVDSCERCAEALEQMSQVRIMLQSLPQEPAPRSFALTPAMAGAGPAPAPAAPKRSPLVFAPVAALTLFVALFAVDLSSSSSSSRDEMFSTSAGGTAGEAQVASAGSAAEDSSAPERASSLTLPEGTPIPPPATGAGPLVPPATGPAPEATILSGSSMGEAGAVKRDDGGAGDATFSSDGDTAGGGEDGATDWLLIGQVVAALAFVISAAYVFVPGIRKRGI